MQRMQVMTLAECLAAGYQCRVVFQARQLLPRLQQAAAQMSLARAPVQPMLRCFGKLQSTGEGFDLLPFAPRYIDVQPMARRFECASRQLIHGTQGSGHCCQGSKGLRCIQKGRLVVSVFRVFQRPLA
ncbi:hypothetical protein D3C81_1395230 [compost metagenome]